MRTTMKVLAAVVLLTAACGGAPYSNDSSWNGKYTLAGQWQVFAGPSPAGKIDLAPDLATGTYTEAGTVHALTAHTFSAASPDFSLSFGSLTLAAKLSAADNSNVFNGTLGTQAVSGVFVPH